MLLLLPLLLLLLLPLLLLLLFFCPSILFEGEGIELEEASTWWWLVAAKLFPGSPCPRNSRLCGPIFSPLLLVSTAGCKNVEEEEEEADADAAGSDAVVELGAV